MLKNGDRSGGKPESARRFCHALRSEAGGAFDISSGRKNKRLLHDSRLFPRCRSRVLCQIARGASRARGGFKTRMSGRAETGLRWAELLAKLRASGRAMPIKDSLIAATALVHDLVVAT